MRMLERIALIALFSLWLAFPKIVLALSVDTPAKHAILLDVETNTVLFEKASDGSMAPSSMSKLMTAYVVFDMLKSGKLKMDDTFHVSEKAWSTQGSKMFVDINTDVRIEDLLRGMIIQSGNDACIVLAEGISGSEEAFANLLNVTAKKIGLRNSNFVNASGLPDPNHRTTARDLSVLAERLMIDFPEYTKFYHEKEFTYHNIKQGNRNPLLYGFPGADGLKTGHTDDAGYGLVGTALRDSRRLVLVVNGLSSMQERADESRRLLEWGFREFRNYKIFSANSQIAEIPVWAGVADTVPVTSDKDILFTLANTDRKNIQIAIQYNEPARAPIAAGDKLANLIIQVPGGIREDYPLYAARSVERLGFFSRAFLGIHYLIFGQ